MTDDFTLELEQAMTQLTGYRSAAYESSPPHVREKLDVIADKCAADELPGVSKAKLFRLIKSHGYPGGMSAFKEWLREATNARLQGRVASPGRSVRGRKGSKGKGRAQGTHKVS